VPDPSLSLVDRLECLAEAVFTLAAIQVGIRENLTPDQAARRVAEHRHEVRHALARWRPPQDSYRARDLA
jgi:hypothetical protein